MARGIRARANMYFGAAAEGRRFGYILLSANDSRIFEVFGNYGYKAGLEMFRKSRQ